VFIEQLVGRLVERVERRSFEVWETAAAGPPPDSSEPVSRFAGERVGNGRTAGRSCFMVAAALTRQEAVGVANERARLHPRPTLLVLDGRGNLVYRA
jgi:hypothetical protein